MEIGEFPRAIIKLPLYQTPPLSFTVSNPLAGHTHTHTHSCLMKDVVIELSKTYRMGSGVKRKNTLSEKVLT